MNHRHPPARASRLLPAGLAGGMLLLSAAAAPARLAAQDAAPAAGPQQQCAGLKSLDLVGLEGGEAATKILSAEYVTDLRLDAEQRRGIYFVSRMDGFPQEAPEGALPAHCVVKGYINPHIQFEIRLPASDGWNGKFLFSTCNGFCGEVESGVTVNGLLRRYATMTSDGGHVGDSSFDATWARDNLQARIDFGHRANHVAAIAGKAVIQAYYGSAPRYSYITGCSKGGQAGVMAAQRYPNDFDGVLARGPTIDYTGVNLLHCGQKAHAVYKPDGSLALDASRHALIKDAVMAYCDPKDGLEDGLISDPRKCDFDPRSIQCPDGARGERCLSSAEADALRKIYAPVRDKAGNVIYPATDLGSEVGWEHWVLPRDKDHVVMSSLALRGYISGVAFEKAPPPDYDWRDFDWDRDRDRLYTVSAIVDATHPDLTAFRDAGGKMIVVHGWADEAVPASATVKWYEDVLRFMGGREKTAEFARLFLMPGMSHCGPGGVGPSSYDALDALEAWVERGVPPDVLLTRQDTYEGPVTRTRPVYPYPIETRYKGRGDIDSAESFGPFLPRSGR